LIYQQDIDKLIQAEYLLGRAYSDMDYHEQAFNHLMKAKELNN